MPAGEVIASRAGNTLLLGGVGFVLIFTLSLLLGMFCAQREGTLFDRAVCKQYDIIIDRKEVNALSKRKKKRGNKAEPDSYLNLVTAILNLVIAILLLIEKLTE